MRVTDEELRLLQAIFNLHRSNHPASKDLVAQVQPLIDAGLVEMHGEVGDRGEVHLSVPARVQQDLALAGQFLRVR